MSRTRHTLARALFDKAEALLNDGFVHASDCMFQAGNAVRCGHDSVVDVWMDAANAEVWFETERRKQTAAIDKLLSVGV